MNKFCHFLQKTDFNTDFIFKLNVCVSHFKSGNCVLVSDGDPNQADVVAAGGVHPTYVQYVEGSPEQAIYTATNGQM